MGYIQEIRKYVKVFLEIKHFDALFFLHENRNEKI